MKNTKKLISIVLAALLLVSVFSISFTANAADTKKGKTSGGYITSGDYSYYLNEDGTAEIENYTGTDENLVIPSSLDGHTVIRITSEAFWECYEIKTIQIPDSITSIGSDAFSGTGYYENEDNWEDGVLYIGKFLIKADNMSGTYTIKSGTTVIADDAFYENHENEDYVDSNDYISTHSELEGIVIPSSVTYIGDCAFLCCEELKNVTISNGVKSIGTYAFDGCSSLKSITVPDSVTTIDIGAFYDCTDLENATLPNGIKEISEDLFSGCSALNNFNIPSSVTTIGETAFSACSSLNNITIPSGITKIGDSAFSNTAYYNNENNWTNGALYFDKYLLDTNDYVTPGSFTVKAGTELIAEYAFYNCSNITSVTLPDSVKYINLCAFFKCFNLAEVSIGKNVKEIGNYAFENTSIKSVTIPSNVTTIGKCAFGYYYDDDGLDINVANFTINGYAGTAAETYANENGFTFNKLTPPAPPKKVKKTNTLKVSTKTKAVKAKKLKKKKQTVKPLTIKNAKGTVTVTKVKKGSTAKLFKKITVNKKTGAITIKKGKYSKKTYKIKLKITAAGNSDYNSKTLTQVVKIKVK